jgi:hypothetical protein
LVNKNLDALRRHHTDRLAVNQADGLDLPFRLLLPTAQDREPIFVIQDYRFAKPYSNVLDSHPCPISASAMDLISVPNSIGS